MLVEVLVLAADVHYIPAQIYHRQIESRWILSSIFWTFQSDAILDN